MRCISADPLFARVVRRVKTSALSLFPFPRGSKNLKLEASHNSADGPRPVFLELRITILIQRSV